MTFNSMLVNNAIAPLAHAGHGSIDANHPAHYVTNPEHALVILAILTSVICLAGFALRRAYRISKPT
ncbi:MAG: hypothetical protein NTV29_13360 [Planctomycetota bacterium]|nr:hypothetical protein [Planctomycetota bacterium]